MDDLPPAVVVDILSRLGDSGDVARCRVASKPLNALSCELRSITLLCSLSRYLKSRSPETSHLVTPFKSILRNLVLTSPLGLHSVSIGVDKSLGGISYDDVEDESDDLHLTDVAFVNDWLPRTCVHLRSLSIWDFWIQSCWRRSDVLALISSCCNGLVELEVKNAWLSVDGLNLMPTLTSLTLEFIRLDDEDLDMLNDCFPFLQILNLIGVGGLKEPKIHLLHLKTCQWTVSNAPVSLAIFAPNLVKLKLKCIKPRSLLLDTPLLSEFDLSLDKADVFKAKEMLDLRELRLECSNISSVVGVFVCRRTIEKLNLDSLKWAESDGEARLSLELLFHLFPEVRSLALGPGAWSEVEASFQRSHLKGRMGMKGVTEIVAHLVVYDIDVTLSFIFSVLEKCSALSDMALLIHREVDSSVTSNLISRCSAHCPRIRWRWGLWEEGVADTWISGGI